MRYARWLGFGDGLAETLEAALGVDEGGEVLDCLFDAAVPVQSLHGARVHGGEDGQVRVEVVHLAQVLQPPPNANENRAS